MLEPRGVGEQAKAPRPVRALYLWVEQAHVESVTAVYVRKRVEAGVGR